jgi:hypothetical protein
VLKTWKKSKSHFTLAVSDNNKDQQKNPVLKGIGIVNAVKEPVETIKEKQQEVLAQGAIEQVVEKITAFEEQQA